MELLHLIEVHFIDRSIYFLADVCFQAQLLRSEVTENDAVVGDTFRFNILLEAFPGGFQQLIGAGNIVQQLVHAMYGVIHLIGLAAYVGNDRIALVLFGGRSVECIGRISQRLGLADGLEYNRAHTAAEIIIEQRYNAGFGRVVHRRISQPVYFGLHHVVIRKEHLVLLLVHFHEFFGCRDGFKAGGKRVKLLDIRSGCSQRLGPPINNGMFIGRQLMQDIGKLCRRNAIQLRLG